MFKQKRKKIIQVLTRDRPRHMNVRSSWNSQLFEEQENNFLHLHIIFALVHFYFTNAPLPTLSNKVSFWKNLIRSIQPHSTSNENK